MHEHILRGETPDTEGMYWWRPDSKGDWEQRCVVMPERTRNSIIIQKDTLYVWEEIDDSVSEDEEIRIAGGKKILACQSFTARRGTTDKNELRYGTLQLVRTYGGEWGARIPSRTGLRNPPSVASKG